MLHELSAPVHAGDLVAGKYRIERKLAQGGMGVVMAARHEALDQRVVIKFLLPEIAAVPQAVARFLREARAAAQIPSDHVARVHDVGTLESGAPYMVMEYLEGRDLSAELEKRGALPVAEAVGYVREALDALCEAHQLGIVHRDLKPSNLFLVQRGDGSRKVKVLDFGISKFESATGGVFEAKLTSTQSMLGSPAYMSPEQVRSSKTVDARSDLWSLGVILHETITGASLFAGDTLGEVFSKIREDDIPPLSAKQPDVPAELDRIVMRCLARRPDERWSSAAELRAALTAFVAGSSASMAAGPASNARASFAGPPTSAHGWAPRASPAAETLAAPSSPDLRPSEPHTAQTVAEWAAPDAPATRGRLWLGVGVAVLAAGAVGAYVAVRGHAAPASPTAEATPAVSPPAASVAAAATAVASTVVEPGSPAPAAPTSTESAPAPSATASARAVEPSAASSARRGLPPKPAGRAVDLFGDRH